MTQRQPTFYIPHGGGPCFFMPDPNGTWTQMGEFLKALPRRLPEAPKAILVISGHWETKGFALTSAAKPSLYFDYYNFPPHTYELTYPAPGAPDLAKRVADLLTEAGFEAALDPERGLDHGVFVPLKVAFPDADLPVVELSLDSGLDPKLHMAVGKALSALRDEGVLILATGMSFHNMRGYGDPRFSEASDAFDAWLTRTLEAEPEVRAARLADWQDAPAARACHPREEHLLPLMVAAGAADGKGERIYGDHVLRTAVSGYQFS